MRNSVTLAGLFAGVVLGVALKQHRDKTFVFFCRACSENGGTILNVGFLGGFRNGSSERAVSR